MPIDKIERTTKQTKHTKKVSLSCVSSVSWFSTKFLGVDFGPRSDLAPVLPNVKLRFPMAEIVLTTLNAKYIHAAFGLRYLLANLGPLKPRAGILEFDINQRPLDIAEALLAHNPKIIGF